jgi:hypothetical protein
MSDAVAEATPIPKPHDISVEQFREYVYPNGDKLRITGPKELYIMANGSHRVVDASGLTHRPTPGYLGIAWKQSDGRPFSF